jgi:hypothetical protein
VAYAKSVVDNGPGPFVLAGIRPVIDADLGWVF